MQNQQSNKGKKQAIFSPLSHVLSPLCGSTLRVSNFLPASVFERISYPETLFRREKNAAVERTNVLPRKRPMEERCCQVGDLTAEDISSALVRAVSLLSTTCRPNRAFVKAFPDCHFHAFGLPLRPAWPEKVAFPHQTISQPVQTGLLPV